MEGPLTGPRRQLARDWVAIAGTAVLVVAVHFLVPASVQARLTFDYGAFDPVTLYTSAFVHTDDQHMLSNVTGFLAAAVTAYMLAAIAERRHWFRLTFVAFLLVLPVLVNLTSYALITSQAPGATPVSRGFSGVAAGFVGFVFAALLQAMARRFSRPVAWYLGIAIWLLLLLEVYFIYAGGVSVPVAGVVLTGWALCVWGLLAQGRLPPVEDPWARVRSDAVWVGLAVALLLSSLWALFPADIVADGAIRNVFAHGAGFLLGFGLSLLLLRAPSVVGLRPGGTG
jgi:hypothetical protein